MRYLLATVAFIIAALCLGYGALFAFQIGLAVSENGYRSVFGTTDDADWWPNLAIILGNSGGAFAIGMGLLAVGRLVLTNKPRRQQ